MKLRICVLLALMAALAFGTKSILDGRQQVRRLANETADLQAANAAKDSEIAELKSHLAGLRASQEATENLLSATIARLNALAASTNANRRSIAQRPVRQDLGATPDINNPPPKRAWGPEQAEGPPDTAGPGDIQTAWASRDPDGGEEWLRLEYDNWVEPAEIHVRETFNPGAISRVTALAADGQEIEIWSGVEPAAQGTSDSIFRSGLSMITRTATVYLDTARVPGWNEIDAVELVGRDGSHQWAKKASASSSYADRASLQSLSWPLTESFFVRSASGESTAGER